MKTIEQLKQEGLLSVRTYNAIVRGMSGSTKYASQRWNSTWNLLKASEYTQLTVKDVFDLFEENEIVRWKGLGSKGLEELKSLA